MNVLSINLLRAKSKHSGWCRLAILKLSNDSLVNKGRVFYLKDTVLVDLMSAWDGDRVGC